MLPKMSPIQELLESIEKDQKAFRRAHKEMARVFEEWKQLRDDSTQRLEDLERELCLSADSFQQDTRLSLQTQEEIWREEWEEKHETLLRKVQQQHQLQKKQHQEIHLSLHNAQTAFETLHEKQERSRSKFIEWSSQIHDLIHERVKLLEEAYKRMKQRQQEEERVLRVEWEEWAKHHHASLLEEQQRLRREQKEATLKQTEFAVMMKKAQRNLERETHRNFLMVSGASILASLSFIAMMIMLFKG